METTLLAAVIAGAVSLSGAIITGRLNRRTVEAEKTLPPYETLAGRVGDMERELIASRTSRREIEKRADCLEDAVNDLRNDLAQDRAWIKQAITAAEHHDALDRIRPLPAWVDLDSDSMRERRRRNNPDQ